MPVAFIPTIELFLDLTGDVAEMTYIMILEGFQTGDDRSLLLLCGHVSSLNEHFSVSIGTK